MKPNPVSPSSLNAELINLPAFSGRKWWVKFDEPEFSCEAGLTAIAASKIGDQLLRFLASAIDDSRCAADHKIEELDSQRGFLILGGNCDVTDCDHLSKDIVLRSATERPLILKRTQGKPVLWSVNHRVWPPRPSFGPSSARLATGLDSLNQTTLSLSRRTAIPVHHDTIHGRFSETSTAFLTAVLHRHFGQRLPSGFSNPNLSEIRRNPLEHTPAQARPGSSLLRAIGTTNAAGARSEDRICLRPALRRIEKVTGATLEIFPDR